jgi:hypothetical protein
VTTPTDHINRVEVGSFNKESPFYQMNLNDLKPFALLKVRLLDVYPLVGEECNEEGEKAGKKIKQYISHPSIIIVIIF